MGVAEDAALFLQVDFEVFGHVQGDLTDFFLFFNNAIFSFLFNFYLSKNTIIIIVRYTVWKFTCLVADGCSIFNVLIENMRANKLNDEQLIRRFCEKKLFCFDFSSEWDD